MISGFDIFKAKLAELVDSYQGNLSIRKGDYDEAALRHDYLDPFWAALGWDTHNEKRFPQQLREVEIESRVEINGRKKRADYIFRTDGISRFICEAKKPTEVLRAGEEYQAQRYAFNLRLLVGTLSTFGDLRVYIVGGKPDSTRPFPYCKRWIASEYVEHADEIWKLLGRDSVSNGSLDRFVASFSKREIGGRPRQGWLIVLDRVRTVDEEFLDFVEQSREHLARFLYRDNHEREWDKDSLNECVQRILDRILFIRICEDRDIDTGRTLESILSSWQSISANRPPLYDRIVGHFRDLDQSFNGALFKRHVSEDLIVADDFLLDFIRELSSEDSPYIFSTMPVEILGSVYERFIGRTAKITKAGPRFELKPELLKADGVYYTPEYIVDFIVGETVGNLVSGKSPSEMARLRFADPACGSGSFLLRVYATLMNEHIKWYTANPDKQRNHCQQDPQGNVQLLRHDKRKILTNCIYGVDLDEQAIEVTMLSLYLKLLEGETKATVAWQQSLFPQERLLPDLSGNVKCGNALVSAGQATLLEEEGDGKAFNWEENFPDIFRNGGFDAVVGNPPYGAELPTEIRGYLSRHFAAGTTDTAALMMLHARRHLTKKKGWNGFIVPKPFTYSSNWKIVRDELLPELKLLVDVGKVWQKVRLEQVIYTLQCGVRTERYSTARRCAREVIPIGEISKQDCAEFEFLLNGVSAADADIALAMRSCGRFLNDFVQNTRGAMFQDAVDDSGKGLRVIGGKQVQQFHVDGQKGFLNPRTRLLDQNAHVQPGSVLVQNIVAHIENPIDHIKISAAIVPDEEASKIVILDTVNQLTNTSRLSSYYFVGLLNSALINWYVYRFVYAKAIRTMHFDGPVTSRIPIPQPGTTNRDWYDRVVLAATRLTSIRSQPEKLLTDTRIAKVQERTAKYMAAIDNAVFQLFGLSDEQIEVVCSAMPSSERGIRTSKVIEDR